MLSGATWALKLLGVRVSRHAGAGLWKSESATGLEVCRAMLATGSGDLVGAQARNAGYPRCALRTVGSASPYNPVAETQEAQARLPAFSP
jgi:hypothetical protein